MKDMEYYHTQEMVLVLVRVRSIRNSPGAYQELAKEVVSTQEYSDQCRQNGINNQCSPPKKEPFYYMGNLRWHSEFDLRVTKWGGRYSEVS